MDTDSGGRARPRVIGALLEAAPDAMVVIDSEGRILLANAQADAMFGYAREDLVGRSIDMLVPAAVQELHRKHREAYLADPHVRPMGSGHDLQACRKDGSEFPVEISLAPLHSDEGLLISAAVRDVTRKRQEERLFRGLLEAAPDAMVIVDAAGCIVLVNARVEEWFGYQRDELIGRSVELLVPDRFAGMHVDFRSGYVAEPRSRPMGLAGDLHARRKDGSEFPVEISLAPLETEGGLLVSAAVRDISERRRMQEESDRVKDEFFATVSHELRTPLTSMLGYSELMGDLEQLSAQGRRFLEVITRSAERELRLVDDLLTLVAIEDSGMSVRRSRVNLEVVVRDAVDAARPRADEVDILLVMELPGLAVQVPADRDRIGQAVDNLLSNAIKFTPGGGQVRVRLGTHAGYAEIDVSDSGTGVPAMDAHRIFERLYRSDRAIAQQVPGAGLGLTIARAIAEAHQGTLTLTGNGASGATFRIRIPLA